MSNLSKITNALNNLITNNNNRTKRARPNNRRRNRRRRNNRNITPRNNRALPAAYASHVRARFNIVSRNANRCIVSGCDLVYSIPSLLESAGDTIFTVIPSNPSYWLGTRIARMAPAYQNFRPLLFKCSYIPQVAVTQAGTVFMGTLWDQAAPSQNIQQTLVTSNGGQLTQCYIPADTNIALGNNLQQNLFQTTGSLSSDSNPFIFLAGVRGATVVPGYFYVTYRYEFRNPIGDAWTFVNTGLTTVANLPEQQASANGTIILLNQTGSLGPGTQLDRESDGFYYNGSPIELEDQTPVVFFNNFQTSSNTQARMSPAPKLPVVRYLTSGTDDYLISNLPYGKDEVVTPDNSSVLVTIEPDVSSVHVKVGSARTVDTSSKYRIVPKNKRLILSSSPEEPYLYIDLDDIQTGDIMSLSFTPEMATFIGL